MNIDNKYSHLSVDELWNRVGEISLEHLKKYIEKICWLIHEKKYKFDLIIAAGDSGIGMVEITKLIYKRLGKPFPQVLKFPIYRYYPGSEELEKNEFDNDHLIPELKRQLNRISRVEEILFVDDEIGQGNTARISIELILSVLKCLELRKEKLLYVIVAEDQGFEVDSIKLGVRVEFYPFASEIKGLNNIVSYNIPYKIYSPIRKIYEDTELESKAMMNVLLDQPVKEFNNGKPRFTYKYNKILKRKIGNFEKLQKEYREFLRDFIENALDK
ncbi:phosphoribosyltransferase [Candidatus Dojkabacteria bacterium]|nr:phosphoribosyltransferase [Candidatus Dojkabacteria bacterium]